MRDMSLGIVGDFIVKKQKVKRGLVVLATIT